MTALRNGWAAAAKQAHADGEDKLMVADVFEDETMEELEELSQVVSDYYARKAEEGMNHLWETGQWSKEKDEEVMKTHLRTPYKYAK